MLKPHQNDSSVRNVPRVEYGRGHPIPAATSKLGRLSWTGLAIAGVSTVLVTSTLVFGEARRDTPDSALRERGQYLVKIAGCHDCHTPNYLVSGAKTAEQDMLTGTTLGSRGPWGTVYATNLRLFFQDITEEQWLNMAREMQRQPSMPYFSLNAMSAADLKAIYGYMRHLGPAGDHAPNSVGPDREPPQPYVMYPGAPR